MSATLTIQTRERTLMKALHQIASLLRKKEKLVEVSNQPKAQSHYNTEAKKTAFSIDIPHNGNFLHLRALYFENLYQPVAHPHCHQPCNSIIQRWTLLKSSMIRSPYTWLCACMSHQVESLANLNHLINNWHSSSTELWTVCSAWVHALLKLIWWSFTPGRYRFNDGY